MKKLLHLLLFVLAAVAANAQDIIVLTDGSTIQAKVLSITASDVQYKKWSNLDGPTYTQAISGIMAINYQNGTQDRFNAQAAQPQAAPAAPAAAPAQTSAANSSIVTRETASSFSDDRDLVRRYNIENYGVFAKKAKTGTYLAIGGGVVLIGGLVCILYNATSDVDYYYYYAGTAAAIAGAGLCTWGLIMRHKNLKMMKEIDSYSLWQNDFNIGNGRSLNLGVDMLNDYANHDRGIGVGLRLNF